MYQAELLLKDSGKRINVVLLRKITDGKTWQALLFLNRLESMCQPGSCILQSSFSNSMTFLYYGVKKLISKTSRTLVLVPDRRAEGDFKEVEKGYIQRYATIKFLSYYHIKIYVYQ